MRDLPREHEDCSLGALHGPHDVNLYEFTREEVFVVKAQPDIRVLLFDHCKRKKTSLDMETRRRFSLHGIKRNFQTKGNMLKKTAFFQIITQHLCDNLLTVTKLRNTSMEDAKETHTKETHKS
ncbi:hypothetical protein CDAR_397321 [Caerostris darwini]|uniref:Uncharacterized protein n=1 Tax=Caerostris darwini TaxID=1538125 RepID=A0AAV4T561_9ARAC|nr:hypothetical protein CDAR_397321 [Caerostris darwini]